jgi:hypothetical protein
MPAAPYAPAFVNALLASYARALGEPLVPAHLEPAAAAAWLYAEADFAVLAHDTQVDPLFVYANEEAQRHFESPWQVLVGMPSRLSAEAPERTERAAMLAQVAQHGFTRGYRGIRVARSGRRFWIEGGTIWNVLGPEGEPLGQAATFRLTRPA